MFTGIIEEIGMIEEVLAQNKSMQLTITAHKVLEDVRLGDSIAVNGVCLTVTSFTSERFTVDVMPETFRDTSLSRLSRGLKVNLERAMAANGRFGGHFVSGHIDGVGVITGKKRVENALYIDIQYSAELSPYLMPKGSIALDGTSLTLFYVSEKELTISLIPHTQEETILAEKAIGDLVNIECDMLAKYVERMLSRKAEKPASNVTMDLLQKHGFA
ncbi:riboflavin synthase [Bacillus badius]|uniref:Riboflavin synthase n=1 Tax=Bacillus badius TaxID=1455 RepID=A0ABR5AWI7_BACBA|nr:riboflavin synthase [Bacillus badius]KIL74628.1 Riboflavin synthase [Bacillus badius]KIL79093.1 Riboflavin synthase [Bacillus badius]MED4715481.1 riboflavin synthase [Bacillus badius]